jgi:predicted RNA-binding Zn ribbon-like protein
VSETLKNQAPGALDTIRAFVNTREVETGKEHLDTPEKLGVWLAEHGLPAGSGISPRDLRNAVQVREALRAFLLTNAGEDMDDKAVATLNAAARRARLGPEFAADGSARLGCGVSGVDGAIGALLVIATTAMAEGTWSRLKACRAERCQWAFYDHTRNHSGVWCDMAVCGNRAKVRAYRERHSHDPP